MVRRATTTKQIHGQTSTKPKHHPHTQSAVRYAREVTRGEIVACRYVIQACRRFLADWWRCKHDPDWPFYYDAEAAERFGTFAELMPHVKGEWAKRGELIKLPPWRRFINCNVFGFKRKSDRTRRFRTVYEEEARKNGKSTNLSLVGLYMLALDGEAGADCYSAATKKDQARIVFDDAKAMARRATRFRDKFGVKIFAHSLTVPRTNSKFQALDAEAKTQDGLNVHLVINDEVHAQRSRGLYDVLETAMGARAQPLMWNITTAGSDESGICYELRSYLLKVLSRQVVDDTFFGLVYTLDEGDDWTDEKNWPKANPNWGVSVQPDDMRRLARKAMETASARPNFKTKRLNLWVNADVEWMDMDGWRACADRSLTLDRFAGRTCWIALDLATKKDICAKVYLFKDGSKTVLIPRFYVPEEVVREGQNSQYAGWVEDGWLAATPGNVTDLQGIETEILGDPTARLIGDKERFDIAELAYDPWQAAQMAGNLGGAGVITVEIRPTVQNFSEAMKELEARVRARSLIHDGNPVMSWMMSNVVCHVDKKDNIYPNKPAQNKKIDGPVAAIMAMNRLLSDTGPPPPSVYESRGLLFLN